MKVAAGIIALLVGLASLTWIGLFGGLIGMGASALGETFASADTRHWGEIVQVLSWAAPVLAIVGGALAFSVPGFASIVLAGSAYCHWLLLGHSSYGPLFTAPIAVAAVLAFIAAMTREPRSIQKGTAGPGASARLADADFDRAKWNALLQYDGDIAAAAQKLRPEGEKWVDELATAYLALNDKAYLPQIVDQITARAKQETEELRQRDVRIAERQRADEQIRLHRQEARRARIAKWKERAWGSRTGKLITVSSAVALVAAAYFVVRALQPPKVNESVVWAPQANDDLMQLNCFSDNSGNCLADHMKGAGASASAVAFARRVGKQLSTPRYARQVYAEKFLRYGPVDAVQIVFPFENQGIANEDFLLVNGPQGDVDVNEKAFALSAALNQQPIFSDLLGRHPNATVWAGVEFVDEESMPNGAQRFVFRYPLLDGCHACDLLGTARFAFDFDPQGRFAGDSVVGIDEK